MYYSSPYTKVVHKLKQQLLENMPNQLNMHVAHKTTINFKEDVIINNCCKLHLVAFRAEKELLTN